MSKTYSKYHDGKNVMFLAKKDRTAELDRELQVGVDEDYCRMWGNPDGAGSKLTVVLRRR